MKTRIHSYCFHISDPEDKKAHKELCKKLRASGVRWMNCWDNNKSKATLEGEIELETAYIFDNQWNTVCGHRVFDWFEAYTTNKVRYGHWLEMTSEMLELRAATKRCGYCGTLYGPLHLNMTEDGFCHKCIGSPHLKKGDIMLLRIRSLGHDEPYNELTDAEMSHLMPEYIASQISGQAKRKEERQIEQRQSAIEDCDSKTSNALAARDGKLWLLDHGVDLDNVIYYTHTRKFAFGWRNPLAPEVRSALLDILSEFPFEYEFSEPKY